MASTMRHWSWQLQLPFRVGGSYYVGASKNISVLHALAMAHTHVRYSDMASTKLGGNPVNTNGSLPTTNSPAPSFTLVKDDLSEVTNADLAGKRVVLNIFPSVDTPTCAKSVRKFNELAGALNNTVVLCVSADLPFAQKRFCGTESLTNVQNASSFRTNFGDVFGVTLVDSVLKGLLARAVVVINESGQVTHTELVDEIANEPNYDAALAALK